MMNMACVALPAALRQSTRPQASEPGALVWADSVASLFTAATRRSTLSNHAVTLALRYTAVSVPWDTIVSEKQESCCKPP
jgi:hypothetical protein